MRVNRCEQIFGICVFLLYIVQRTGDSRLNYVIVKDLRCVYTAALFDFQTRIDEFNTPIGSVGQDIGIGISRWIIQISLEFGVSVT
jgi:hypothetical protein